MSRIRIDVTVCDGWDGEGLCQRVFNRDDVYLTVVLRAVRSDMPRDEQRGVQRYTAESKAGLRKEMHIHPTCTLPHDAVPALIQHAASVRQWPESNATG